jgi:hypothetical protein
VGSVDTVDLCTSGAAAIVQAALTGDRRTPLVVRATARLPTGQAVPGFPRGNSRPPETAAPGLARACLGGLTAQVVYGARAVSLGMSVWP